jgi:transposase
MAHSRTRFIGMDGHKDSIAVASVAQDQGAEGTYVGTFGTRQCDSAHRLRTMPATAQQLIFVDAAGPCGSWLYRDRSKTGDDGWVVAPSVIPQQPGDRVTTDRRDAVPWARLARSGALPAVYVPTGEDEAMRALTRARAEAISARKDAQWRLQAFWRRHDRRYTGQAHGGAAHRRWLSEGGCHTPAQPIVLQASVRAVNEHSERRQRLAPARHEHVHAWRVSPVVEARHAWRGVHLTVAVTLVAALGDLTRFESPRALMKFMGLLPAAYSSGEPADRGR